MAIDPITVLDPALVGFVRETAGGDAYAAFFRAALAELSLPDQPQRAERLERKIREVCVGASTEGAGPGDDLRVIVPGSTDQNGFVLQSDANALSQVVLLLAQMKLLTDVETGFGRSHSGLVYQFTSNARAVARDSRYAGLPVLLFRPTDLNICTGHLGVVHYRCRLSIGRNTDMPAVELFPFVVLSLESEARRLKRETISPGFDAAHVYNNHGVLGCCGQDPAEVCDRVSIHLTTHTNANPERIAMKLTQFLEEAAAEYVARYAPNTSSLDARHFAVTVLPSGESQNFRVDVFGQAGHPPIQTDSAITKAALLFGALLKVAGNFPGMHAYGRLADSAAGENEKSIVLQGLQTFTPSHRAQDVQKRMAEAAADAMKKYCRLRSRKFDASMIEMSFEEPCLEAVAPADNPLAQALRSAATVSEQPAKSAQSWPSWCGTRPSVIFGPGTLSAGQQGVAEIAELQKALAISVLAARTLTA